MTDPELLRDLNKELWQAFRASYRDLDAPAFLALYSPDLVRAGGPGRSVLDFDGYAVETREFFADMLAQGGRLGIDFRFTERLAQGELASERGVYRIVMRLPGADERVFYGQFHTFARRIGGRLQFVADYDSTEAGTVTEASFAAAHDIDDVAAFATGAARAEVPAG